MSVLGPRRGIEREPEAVGAAAGLGSGREPEAEAVSFKGRYARQERFAGIGPEGQARLAHSRVLLLGCGALGSASAELLVRAGVGVLTVVDRDLVEPSNLQRQSLFDEQDARQALPKAIAAETQLRRLNSEVRVEGRLLDVGAAELPALLEPVDLVLDGSDNFELRYLLNEACLLAGKPWIYAACVSSYGLVLSIRPGATPCLRCVLGARPAAGSSVTCETAGVIGPIVQAVAAVQVAEALKLLCGRTESLLPGLVNLDLWAGSLDVVDLRGQPPSCPTCTERRFEYSHELQGPAATALCGRDAVQVRAPQGTRLDLELLERRLGALGNVTRNPYLLRFRASDAELVVFADGRALIKGTADPVQARSLYARYVGN